jgi:hypothetical protein
MKTRLTVACLFAFGSTVCIAQDPRPFVGDWINVDTKTSGTARLKISDEKQILKIRGWGNCTPGECDWGAVRLHLFRSQENPRRFDYGFASWDWRFAECHMVLHLDQNVLLVDSYTIFKDKSGRTDYRSVATFKRTNDSDSVGGKGDRRKLLDSLH